MKAVTVTAYGGTEVLEQTDVERPEPDDGQIRIAVDAIGVNYADISRRRGDSRSSQTPPFVPGLEAAGVVDAVGAGAEYEVGDRVLTFMNSGAYAEQIVVDTESVFPIPENITFEEAVGLFIQFVTAHNALHNTGDVLSGERILIHAAAGGVGSAAVQLAVDAGATVFATASSDAKLAFASDLGAAHCIDYTETDVVEKIEEITKGSNVELVLDGVGGATFENSLHALSSFGRIVTIGAASRREGNPDLSLVRLKNLDIRGYHLATTIRERRSLVADTLTEIFSLFTAGAITPHIHEVFPFEAVRKAHEIIEARAHTGKVILRA